MAIKPNINPYTAAGNYNEVADTKLHAIETVVDLDRLFTMSDVDEEHCAGIRWCWDHGLLEIVRDRPLTYQLTCLGHELVEKGRACREAHEENIAT